MRLSRCLMETEEGRDWSEAPVPSTWQSLLFLGLVAAICLGLNLLFLTVYVICLCSCKRGEESETKRPNSCCVTWTAVVAGLICWCVPRVQNFKILGVEFVIFWHRIPSGVCSVTVPVRCERRWEK
uniref:Protein tweety homolog n=1 Tax=Gopherus agassizii TaxID=38772 RepID=A0A452H0J2_9SAUR